MSYVAAPNANAGNCLEPAIGPEEDRLYSKMVTKG